MFDFPNSPTLNQVITGTGGIQYRWDGAKWVSGTTPSSYLPLTGGTVSGNLTVTGTATLPNAVAEPALNNVGRSLIHNGLFNVQQRGTGPWSTNSYTADRWQLLLNLDTSTVTISAATDAIRSAANDEAFQWFLTMNVAGNAGAAAFTEIVHKIEKVSRLSGKTCILSFWAWSPGGLRLGIQGYQSFGTGGSPSAAGILTVTGSPITLTGTVTRYSVTIAMPSAAGKTFGTNGDDSTVLQFFGSSGTTNAPQVGVQSGSISIWGVQLEVAQSGQTLPTPLDYGGSPQQQLAQCQRFYQSGPFTWGAWSGTTGTYGLIPLPTTMRVMPTCGLSGLAYGGGASAASISSASLSAIRIVYTSTAASNSTVDGNYTASADL